jgi:hypothetical protein
MNGLDQAILSLYGLFVLGLLFVAFVVVCFGVVAAAVSKQLQKRSHGAARSTSGPQSTKPIAVVARKDGRVIARVAADLPPTEAPPQKGGHGMVKNVAKHVAAKALVAVVTHGLKSCLRK